ncbi:MULTISPECIES: hypothetical protein [Enterobacter]|uniref:hypothetical protein n=1 Tax=Enterobacter TaxID=547 RepID=UPI00190F3B63|nr:hypothetical protein [Enterobacter sp. UCD-UG_FMILLET]
MLNHYGDREWLRPVLDKVNIKTAAPGAEAQTPAAISSPLNFPHSLKNLIRPTCRTVRVAVPYRYPIKQAMAYKEANPLMFVRIIVPKLARVMNTNNSRCYPWEDKKQ